MPTVSDGRCAEAIARNATSSAALAQLGPGRPGPDRVRAELFRGGAAWLPDMEGVINACRRILSAMAGTSTTPPVQAAAADGVALDPMPSVEAVSVVCVLDERELEMATLLARSLARHLHRDAVREILFVHNCFAQPDFEFRFDLRVRPLLEDLDARTRLVAGADMGLPLSSPGSRQVTRMALRLEACRHVASKHVLLLDAMSHLVAPLTKKELFAADGRPNAEFTAAPGVHADRRRASFGYWGVVVDDQARTVAPNLLQTGAVKAMLADIEQRSGQPVQQLLAEDRQRTELQLYAGYLEMRGGMHRFYSEAPRAVVTLFAVWPQRNEDVLRVVRSSRNQGTYALAVHERRYGQLTKEQSREVAEVWSSAQLFESVEEGLAFIARQVAVFGPGTPGEDSPDVMAGRSGRLCIRDGSNRSLEQHLGKHTLDDAAVDRWRTVLRQRQAFCHERSIEYGILIAPDTLSIHAEDFPELGKDSPSRPVGRLQAASAFEQARVVYPLQALREARSRGIVCHTADSHWSAFGAFVAYKELQKAMPGQLRPLKDSDVRCAHQVGDGDLGIKLRPQVRGEYTECALLQASARRTWHNRINNRGWMGLWRNENRRLPRAVLLMDSYGWKFQPFLAESFSSLFVVHSPFLERELIEELKPEVVISIMAERFMIRVPNDASPELALAAARKKLPGATYPSKAEFDAGRRAAPKAGQ